MKKQLTKEQKELRQKKLRKLKDILLYISLGFNCLIILLLCIGGCANKNSANSNSLVHSASQPMKQLNSNINNSVVYGLKDGDLVHISFGPTISGVSNITRSWYLNGYNYGLSYNDDNQNYSYNYRKTAKGDTIYFYTSSTDLGFRFYNYNGDVVYSCSYEYNNSRFINDNYDVFDLYLTYTNKYNNGAIIPENNFYFVDLFNSLDMVEKVDNQFIFKDNWDIYNYFNAPNGITNQRYGPNINGSYFILNSSFYINGIEFKHLYALFDDGITTGNSSYNYYISNSGSPVLRESDEFIFRGLIASNSDYSVQAPIAIPQFASASVKISPTASGYSTISLPIANTFEYTNDIYRKLNLTGACYVSYMQTPLFPYVNTDGYFNIDNTPMSVNYLNYSYTLSDNVIYINTYGDLSGALALLGFAFSGLSGLFGIEVLPSITIGVLLFLPLVVSTIVLVFRMVKK